MLVLAKISQQGKVKVYVLSLASEHIENTRVFHVKVTAFSSLYFKTSLVRNMSRRE